MNDHFHRHCSMNLLQQQIYEGIALQGFAIRHIVTDGNQPDFTYTVGLHTRGSQKPELCMSGLSMLWRVHWMLFLGFLIQGPPSLKTRRRMARSQRVPVEALSFPLGGRVFEPGVRYRNLAENNMPTCFGKVDSSYYESHFGQAVVFHGSPTFPIFQVVWSDTNGRFLFESHFEPRLLGKQQLFFDPQPHLPLREVQEGNS